MENGLLQLGTSLPVQAINAGLFISRSVGKHPERVIDSYEVIFVRSGVLGIHEEGREYDVHEGQAIILRPYCRHGGTRGYLSDLSFYWIHFRLNETAIAPENQVMELPQLVQLSNPDQMTELFRRFLDNQEQGRKSQLSLDLIMLEILCEIADSNASRGSTSQPGVLASHADSYLRTHFHEQLTSRIIAEALSCNPDYLGRVYRRVFGKTLTDAIHEYRLKYACQLLLDSSCNINEAARKSGFEDPGYFRRIFKRCKGISPFTYRRTYALVHVNTE